MRQADPTEEQRASWQSLLIPSCLEITGRPSTKRLTLRLASESDRRKWELHLDASCTPRSMSASLFMLQYRHGWDHDSHGIDLTGAYTLAVSLLSGRASVSGGDSSLSFERFAHTEGLQVLSAMLQAVDAAVQGKES